MIVGAEDTAVDDPRLEWKLSIAALPAALLLAWLFHLLTPGLQRILFGMPVHELGHAITAWLCGYFAVPTLWKTLVPESRGVVAPLGAVLLVQACGTLLVSEATAETLFTFGGDGMGMVLAAALMASFFFGSQKSLRWGFLVIGAAAFVDMFATWFTALWNVDVIPFGENEGSGLSDLMKLLEEHGWRTATMVRRYVAVGVGALAALEAG